MTTLPLRLILVSSLLSLVACGDEAAKGSAPSASAAAATATATAAAPTASASAAADAAPALPADWVDVDLTPAGKVWEGYTLKAPPGAKVKKGFPDPTVEAGEAFALQLSLSFTKKSTANLDTARAYGVSWRALTDTEELFEYETSGEQDGEKFVRFNFNLFPKVDGKVIGCSGLNNQKQREQNTLMMAACRTLRKK